MSALLSIGATPSDVGVNRLRQTLVVADDRRVALMRSDKCRSRSYYFHMDSETQETEEAMPSILDRSQHPENFYKREDLYKRIEKSKLARALTVERATNREECYPIHPPIFTGEETMENLPTILTEDDGDEFDPKKYEIEFRKRLIEAKVFHEMAIERVKERAKLERKLEKKNRRKWRTEEPYRFRREF